jgi:copper transport protein
LTAALISTCHPQSSGVRGQRALRILLVAAFALSGLAVQVVFGATLRPAYAHARLIETSPVDDAVVGSPPPTALLRFNEAVTLTPLSIQLLDPNGKRVRIGVPGHAAGKANTAAAALPADLGKGTYTVAWRVVSEDSHVIAGAFRFSVGERSVAVTSVGSKAGPLTPELHAVGRGLAFLGLALALGGAVFLGVLWPAGARKRRGRLIVWAGFGALSLGTVVVFLAQGPYTTGGSLTTAFEPGVLQVTVGTRFGQALLTRLGIALTLAVVFAIVMRRTSHGAQEAGAATEANTPGAPAEANTPGAAEANTAGTTEANTPGTAEAKTPATMLALGAICGIALVLTWPLTDHAHTGPQAWLAVPATSVHLLAVALWFGGLVPLTACVVGPAAGRSAHTRSLDPALRRFSGLAQVCFATIAVTGLYLSWRQVGELGALGGTRYGRLLLVKFGVVLVIVALAAPARRFVRRHTERPGEPTPMGGLRGLRRSVTAEIVLGAGVLSLTAVLASTAPARGSYAPPVRTKVAVPATTRTRTGLDGGRVEVKLTPARQGANVADIYLLAKDGTLVDVPEVSGSLRSGRKDIGSLPVKLSAAEPGHYVASALSIPYPGPWVLWLNIRTSDFDETPVHISFTAH